MWTFEYGSVGGRPPFPGMEALCLVRAAGAKAMWCQAEAGLLLFEHVLPKAPFNDLCRGTRRRRRCETEQSTSSMVW